MTAGRGAGNRRGRATNQRILAVAAELFEQRGLDLTIDEVAREAGITRMTVHRHVGSREDLVTRLILRASAELASGLREVLDGEGSFAGRLADALVMVVSEIRARPHLASMFTTELSGSWATVDPDDRVIGVVRRFFGPYFAEAEARGLLRTDADVAVGWVLNQVLLLLLVPSVAPTEGDVRQVLEGLAIPAVLDHPQPHPNSP